MILRPYQDKFVGKALRALRSKGNTLGVSPTGSGKTIMLSSLLEQIGGKQLVLQHREELVQQNKSKFGRIAKGRTTSTYGLGTKDDSGDTIFGMAQTLGRNGEAGKLPALDCLVIDEAHHAVAETYRRIVDSVLNKNPNCMIAGFTATAARGDKKGLRPVFDNVCEHIRLDYLIKLGFLVPYRTFIATLPGLAEELKEVRKTASGEFDLEEAGTLMDTRARNRSVVREWEKVAGDRKTIVFCSTVSHARSVCAEFIRHGVKADCVFGDTPNRESILSSYHHGDLQVIVNVAVLTEGYDAPPTSCIVLLRPCSFKSTMIQMIGRGLRTVNPEEYPGIVKKDCIVLDFGESLSSHGSIEMAARLDDQESGDAPMKECPNCNSEVPVGTGECPICGFEFTLGSGEDDREESDVVLTEVKIMDMSPFKWVDLFGTEKVWFASGFDAWVTACSPDGENWHALGKVKGEGIKTLAVGDKTPAMAAADDFLRMYEDGDSAKKSKRWLRDPATYKQIELLERAGWPAKSDLSLQKYQAACLLNFLWAKQHIERRMFNGAH